MHLNKEHNLRQLGRYLQLSTEWQSAVAAVQGLPLGTSPSRCHFPSWLSHPPAIIRSQRQRSTRHTETAYLGSERQLDNPREFSIATLTDGVPVFLLRARRPRLARHRQTVVVHVNGDILGRESGKLERCCHDVRILCFVQIKSGEGK